MFVWTDAHSPNTIPRRSDELSLCRLLPRGLARFDENGDLHLFGGTFEAEEPASRALAGALRDAESWTICIAVRSRSATQHATILSLRTDRNQDLITLAQDGPDLMWKVAGTGSTRLTNLPADRPVSVAVEVDPTKIRTYLDGQPRGTVERPSPAVWPNGPCRLVLGAGPNSWRGRLSNLAIHRGLLSQAALRDHHRASHRDRPAIPRRQVEARLEQRIDAPPSHLYRQALVVYSYRTEEPNSRSLRVAHLAVLNGRPLESVESRTVGTRYLLELEPFADHPELHSHPMADPNPLSPVEHVDMSFENEPGTGGSDG